MELRKDPVTQAWVVVGQREPLGDRATGCPLEPDEIEAQPAILTWPHEGAWQIRVMAHPRPIYRIEGEAGRLPDGIYDKMGALGAHEVVVETPKHDRRLSQFSDEEIERVLWVWASRTADLKKDHRFKYVSVFKNQGPEAGEDWPKSTAPEPTKHRFWNGMYGFGLALQSVLPLASALPALVLVTAFGPGRQTSCSAAGECLPEPATACTASRDWRDRVTAVCWPAAGPLRSAGIHGVAADRGEMTASAKTVGPRHSR